MNVIDPLAGRPEVKSFVTHGLVPNSVPGDAPLIHIPALPRMADLTSADILAARARAWKVRSFTVPGTSVDPATMYWMAMRVEWWAMADWRRGRVGGWLASAVVMSDGPVKIGAKARRPEWSSVRITPVMSGVAPGQHVEEHARMNARDFLDEVRNTLWKKADPIGHGLVEYYTQTWPK
jgi:hypothetical protein